MLTIREAYNKALDAAIARGVPVNQQKMVAALAVKDAMEDTLDNLKALQVIIKEINNDIYN